MLTHGAKRVTLLKRRLHFSSVRKLQDVPGLKLAFQLKCGVCSRTRILQSDWPFPYSRAHDLSKIRG